MKDKVQIHRGPHGVPHVDAPDEVGLYWGLGYAHARDRGLQMLFMRILGRGTLSEHLDSSEASLAIDTFFRKMNWTGGVTEQVEALSEPTKRFIDAYCDGVNTAFSEKTPWELKLLGYRQPDPWSVDDSVLLSRMTGFLTLGQSQGEVERLFVELVQAGVTPDKLEELFPGILGGLDIEALQKVTLEERIVPPEVLWEIGAPRLMASNSWVVSGSRTESGKPLLANDVHLEVNRIPAIWYEIMLRTPTRYCAAFTMPGLPGLLIGRTNDLSWGVTYAFQDATDYWIEQCRDGKYLYDGEWLPFRTRTETIKRKKKPPVEVTFYDNDHGVLEGDPNVEGSYLTICWAGLATGALSFNGMVGIFGAETIEDGMRALISVEGPWCWVLADAAGDIGFQMSGMVPRRRKGVSGFVPLPGWEPANDWQGMVPLADLPRVVNPEQGYFVTANQDLNAYGSVQASTIAMGPYRAERIAALLEEKEELTAQDMSAIHADVFSTQAESFMAVLKPLLPDTEQGRLLQQWDCCYDPASQGAYLFEQVYQQLYSEVFGRGGAGMGEQVIDHLWHQTGTFIDFYLNFDRVLLSESSAWFGEESRDDIFSRAARKALNTPPIPWGETRQVSLPHVLFGGKLPRFLGFDRGPITLPGGRATVCQGQIYQSGGRTTTFAPSMHMVADMAGQGTRTNLAGGPSDRRFSRWYCSELEAWVKGTLKHMKPSAVATLPFP